jgi:hypothetical protein
LRLIRGIAINKRIRNQMKMVLYRALLGSFPISAIDFGFFSKSMGSVTKCQLMYLKKPEKENHFVFFILNIFLFYFAVYV